MRPDAASIGYRPDRRLPAACPPFGDPGLRSATVRPGERGFDEPAALRGGLGGLAALPVFALFLRVFAMLAFGGLGGLMAVFTRARRGRELPRLPKELCQRVGNVPFLAMFLYVAGQVATAMNL
jgi:hypothetical protein